MKNYFTEKSPQALLISSLNSATNGLSLAQLLAQHPQLARRSVQRAISELIAGGEISALGQGRARRYFVERRAFLMRPEIQQTQVQRREIMRAESPVAVYETDRCPPEIPRSADSQDILAYINQPLFERKPVGYQHEFLESYVPNETYYLPQNLRHQLHQIGRTTTAYSPVGTYSRAILNRLLIDLSWASSQLEGNTYSLLDTRQLIERGKAGLGKAQFETQMILNHKTAIELLVDNVETAQFNRYMLLNLHSALSENLLSNSIDEGRVRQHAVEIGKSVYRPLDVPQKIDETLDILLNKAQQIHDPFEQSFFAMVHLPYLQAFADVNKRTSRLAANLPLFRANLCPLTFIGVPAAAYNRAILGVYELTRVELLRDLYMWAYQRSAQEYITARQNVAQPDPLRMAWRDTIKKTLRAVVTQPEQDPLSMIQTAVKNEVPDAERSEVQALIVEELRHLHEGSLARYGLRLADYHAWKAKH